MVTRHTRLTVTSSRPQTRGTSTTALCLPVGAQTSRAPLHSSTASGGGSKRPSPAQGRIAVSGIGRIVRAALISPLGLANLGLIGGATDTLPMGRPLIRSPCCSTPAIVAVVATRFQRGAKSVLDATRRETRMLRTKMAPPSDVLRPYVWSYGMTTGRISTFPAGLPAAGTAQATPDVLPWGIGMVWLAQGRVRPTSRRVSPSWVLRRTLGLACPSSDASITSPFISSHPASIGCSASP